MKFKVTYERKTGSTSYYLYSSEIIDVKGIIHAHTRAQDHLRAIQKLSSYPVRVQKIILMPEDEG